VNALHGSHRGSALIRRIYSDLTDRAAEFGLDVDFRFQWPTYVEEQGPLLDMSPQELNDKLFQVFQWEMSRVGVSIAPDGRTLSSPGEIAHNSGLRSGIEGDWWELCKRIAKIFKKGDAGVDAIFAVVQKASEKRKAEWEVLKEEDINRLIQWRDEEQNRWFPASSQANGGVVEPATV